MFKNYLLAEAFLAGAFFVLTGDALAFAALAGVLAAFLAGAFLAVGLAARLLAFEWRVWQPSLASFWPSWQQKP